MTATQNSSFVTAFFIVSENRLQLLPSVVPQGPESPTTIPRGIDLKLSWPDVQSLFQAGPIQVDLRVASSLPPPLTAYPRQLGCQAAAYVPILQKGKLRGLVLIGAREQHELTEEVINAFVRTIWLTTNALEFTASSTEPMDERRASEVKAINTLASNTTSVEDLRTFHKLIHDQVRSVIGNYGFVIALYDQRTNSINIPYLYEDNTFSSIDSFPGKG
jgi:hypothetical protein